MYKIKLENFEGPLDLLLFFVRKDELNIYDIPIAHITKSYLEYLHLMQELNLDIASEFILMAATLMRIKVRCMLPPEPGEENEEEPLDPREELTRRLLEYRQFKEASRSLAELDEQWRLVYRRNFFDPDRLPPSTEPLGLKNVSFFDLLTAYKKAITRSSQVIYHSIERINVSVDQQMNYIRDFFKSRKGGLFTELCEGMSKIEIVVTFLALLDMIRMEEIFVRQSTVFDDIWIQKEPIPETGLPETHEKTDQTDLSADNRITETQYHDAFEHINTKGILTEIAAEEESDNALSLEEHSIIFHENTQDEKLTVLNDKSLTDHSTDITSQVTGEIEQFFTQSKPEMENQISVQDPYVEDADILCKQEDNELTSPDQTNEWIYPCEDKEPEKIFSDPEIKPIQVIPILEDAKKTTTPVNETDTSNPVGSVFENDIIDSRYKLTVSDTETEKNLATNKADFEQSDPFGSIDKNTDFSQDHQQQSIELADSADNPLLVSDPTFLTGERSRSDVTHVKAPDSIEAQPQTNFDEDHGEKVSTVSLYIHSSEEDHDSFWGDKFPQNQTIEPPVREVHHSEISGMDNDLISSDIHTEPVTDNGENVLKSRHTTYSHDAMLNTSDLQESQSDNENKPQPVADISEETPASYDENLQVPKFYKNHELDNTDTYSNDSLSANKDQTDMSVVQDNGMKKINEKKSTIERFFSTIVWFVKKLLKKN